MAPLVHVFQLSALCDGLQENSYCFRFVWRVCVAMNVLRDSPRYHKGWGDPELARNPRNGKRETESEKRKTRNRNQRRAEGRYSEAERSGKVFVLPRARDWFPFPFGGFVFVEFARVPLKVPRALSGHELIF